MFTDEQRKQNFIRLIESIVELKSGRRPTEDWEQGHFTYFTFLRDHFVNFRWVNPDIVDPMYREAMEEAEQYAQKVETYWEGHGRMDYDSYLELLERTLYSYEYTLEDSELSDIMGGLSLKTDS